MKMNYFVVYGLVASCILCYTRVSGIRCFKCDHNEVTSDNNVIFKFILKQLSKVGHPECTLKDKRDRYNVDIVECPTSAEWGYKYVCGTKRGTVSGEWKGLRVQIKTLERECVEVPTGVGGYHDRCEPNSLMDTTTQLLLQTAIEALGDFEIGGALNYEGEKCYDAHGIPVTDELKLCPTCSFNEIINVDSVLGPLVEAFNKNNQQECRMEHPGDKYQVGYRMCKPSYQGEVNKCALVQGEVNAKVLRGIKVRYNTVSRGCAQCDMRGRNAEMYKDGCHTQLPFSEPVRRIIVQDLIGASTKMGDITLRGKVCYNNYTTYVGGKPTPPPTSPPTPQPNLHPEEPDRHKETTPPHTGVGNKSRTLYLCSAPIALAAVVVQIAVVMLFKDK